ncbi:MAG: phosphoribosylamine--glycine ligase [Deltaproteobacteria bacterium]|nr:phosphoribosylamine--glycine ligase [Deltaproteobacteria bacterium]
MQILVLGSGGREHALVWKLKQSPRIDKIYCAPGNAGIGELAQCVAIGANEIEKLADFVEEKGIDLTFVGPEEPLTLGIVDYFESRGLRVFGPSKDAAALEGSKVFMKDLLAKYGIPSGFYQTFADREPAVAYIREKGAPIVVKADGLAAGKGVIVAADIAEAVAAVDLILTKQAFGKAGSRVLIEEFLDGEEASFLAFTDGKVVLPLPSSQDHKAVFAGDKGPNTGGMGAYSPAPVLTPELQQQVMDSIMYPTVRAMAAEGRPYKGILYAGLMIKDGQARVLEFNCRFGDPETQPLLLRLQSDLVDVIEGVINGDLSRVHLDIDARPAVCVVMASEGYPGSYEKGRPVRGLDNDFGPDVVVFHAGTARNKDGQLVNAGGRVFGVTARALRLEDAINAAYKAVAKISWQGCFFRRDIGRKALRRLHNPSAVIGIVLGSDSDLPVFKGCLDFLQKMAISYEIIVASAHRSPERASDYAETAGARGLKVLIAGAGMAAHLAGVLAAHTTIPVIGVPVDSSPLNGLDALLSTVQMPPGVPVATMGIGAAGARNAAILAAQILAVADAGMTEKLRDFKRQMAEAVVRKSESLAHGLCD